MPLDPDMSAILDLLKQMPPLSQTPLELMRGPPLPGFPPGPDVGAVIDERIPSPQGGIRVRLYKPSGPGPWPAVQFMHGGGFVIGSIESHDALCRQLCVGAQVLVASLDYRLAPESRFPAAPDDCLLALRWLAKEAPRFGGDPARLAVAGDSAGGNLAAVTALRARDEGGPALKAQLLIYPATDALDGGHPSIRENAEGYFLSRADMDWFLGQYLASASDAHHPHFAVLRAKNLKDLPPALIITAQFDPLRDEGEAYAQKLEQAGVAVSLKRFDGVIHGFFSMPVAKATHAQNLATDWLKQRLFA